MKTIQNFANTLQVGDVLHWDDEMLAVVEVANYAHLGVTEAPVRVVVAPTDEVVDGVHRTLWLEEDDVVQYDRATPWKLRASGYCGPYEGASPYGKA